VAILVISIHYYKVSREHGISLPAVVDDDMVSPEIKKEAKQRIDFIPDLLTHEVFLTVLGLALLIFIVTYGGYHAPLEHVANPQVTPLDTEAPWYFWWLQGMLKLGDKTLMGVIIPGILVGLLLAIPYIDRNPYRSLYKRPFAVAIGLLGVITLIVLSYMGTPVYRIQTPAATRIIQDLAPEEGVGPLRAIPFDQLAPGVYEVNSTPTERMCPQLNYGCPDLEKVFAEYSDRVNQAIDRGDLPQGQAVLVIEDWQQDLKKVTPRIVWTEDNVTKTYERQIFLHRNRGNE